ncbi:ribonuclease R [Lyngbya confervoides BDU141951]|uniref:Ribonuclease R n=1 Tax=Lyngbya confervoides BDU141951 TaxID=1574623 RepID=A0ABD4T768_9CYAN|nr:ribonuclease R family protein [Lyngbya confervoides]MCM1984345.1 ribonuclease R [Lyngbya confervoides BDU141951]
MEGRRIGVIDRPEGKKHWVVIDASGQSHVVHPRQVSYSVSGQTYAPEEVAQFRAAVEQHLDPTSLEVAWELLTEEQTSTTAEDLSLLLFSEQSPVLCYASFCLLTDDKVFFKRKGDRFEPRSVSQVADIQHQIKREAEREQQQQRFYNGLQAAIAGDSVDWTPSDRVYLSAVENFALFGEESKSRLQAREILSHTDFEKTPVGAFDLLVALGLWEKHENLFLRRRNMADQFPPQVSLAAEQYLDMPPPDQDRDRRDLTHLKVYTIDDESTAEIDDGLSLEFLDDGRERIWVHIADPSRWVVPGDDLDREAQRRTTTVYLPTGMIPMFPLELSTGPMSLTQGNCCCALSFGILLTQEGSLDSYEICTSQVTPTYRLTYEDVDEMLELGVQAESELMSLAKWAKIRQQWRTRQGAIQIQLPEPSIKVQGETVTIDLLPNSMSRELVAEMMILAGEVAATYGFAHGVPLPFRHQAQPDLPTEEELLQLSPGPVRACAIRRCMPRSEVSTTPQRHSSLGLEHYCQVTSPIRRYADLVAHLQIKAHLRGDDLPYSELDLTQLLSTVAPVAYESALVERQTNRYWSLEFLRQQKDEIWRALVLRWLREHENLALVLLEDLGLELPMRFNRIPHLGEALQVKVRDVDPRLDKIVLVEVLDSIYP